MLGSNKKLRDLPIHQGVVPDFCFDDQSANKEIPRGKLLAFDSDVEYLLSCNDANALIYKVKYSKACLKWPLKNRQNKDLNDNW